METSAVAVHEALKSIRDFQTHHRLREAQGRVFAEELNERVQVRLKTENEKKFWSNMTFTLTVLVHRRINHCFNCWNRTNNSSEKFLHRQTSDNFKYIG